MSGHSFIFLQGRQVNRRKQPPFNLLKIIMLFWLRLMHLFLLSIGHPILVVAKEERSHRHDQEGGLTRAVEKASEEVLFLAHDEEESMQLRRFLQETASSCDIQTDESCRTNPQAICEYYNNAGGNSSSVGQCTCQRFGKLDTTITCSFLDDCTNSTLPSCYVGTIERILNPQLSPTTIQTCISFPNSEMPTAVTCIRTFPQTVGNFTELQQCIVQYTPTGQDPKMCHSCNMCDSRNTTTMLPEIAFDCCNLQTDLQQSCSPVTNDGVGIPNFDPIITPGTCTSAAAVAFYGGQRWTMLLAVTTTAVMGIIAI